MKVEKNPDPSTEDMIACGALGSIVDVATTGAYKALNPATAVGSAAFGGVSAGFGSLGARLPVFKHSPEKSSNAANAISDGVSNTASTVVAYSIPFFLGVGSIVLGKWFFDGALSCASFSATLGCAIQNLGGLACMVAGVAASIFTTTLVLNRAMERRETEKIRNEKNRLEAQRYQDMLSNTLPNNNAGVKFCDPVTVGVGATETAVGGCLVAGATAALPWAGPIGWGILGIGVLTTMSGLIPSKQKT